MIFFSILFLICISIISSASTSLNPKDNPIKGKDDEIITWTKNEKTITSKSKNDPIQKISEMTSNPDWIMNKEEKERIIPKKVIQDQLKPYMNSVKSYFYTKLSLIEKGEEKLQFIKYWAEYPMNDSSNKNFFPLFFEIATSILIQHLIDNENLVISFDILEDILQRFSNIDKKAVLFEKAIDKGENGLKSNFIDFMTRIFNLESNGIKKHLARIISIDQKWNKSSSFRIALDRYCNNDKLGSCGGYSKSDMMIHDDMMKKPKNNKIRNNAIKYFKELIDMQPPKLSSFKDSIDKLVNEKLLKSSDYSINTFPELIANINSIFKSLKGKYQLNDSSEIFARFFIKSISHFLKISFDILEKAKIKKNSITDPKEIFEYLFQNFSADIIFEALTMIPNRPFTLETIHYLFENGIQFPNIPSDREILIQKYKSWIFRDYEKVPHDSMTFINGLKHYLDSKNYSYIENAVKFCTNLSREKELSQRYKDCFETIYWSYFNGFNRKGSTPRIQHEMYKFIRNQIVFTENQMKMIENIKENIQSSILSKFDLYEYGNIFSKNLNHDRLGIISSSKLNSFKIREGINLLFQNYLLASTICLIETDISRNKVSNTPFPFIEITRGIYSSLELDEFRNWNPTSLMNMEILKRLIESKTKEEINYNLNGEMIKLTCFVWEGSNQPFVKLFKSIPKYHFYLSFLGKKCNHNVNEKFIKDFKEKFQKENENQDYDALLWGLMTINKPDCTFASEMFSIFEKDITERGAFQNLPETFKSILTLKTIPLKHFIHDGNYQIFIQKLKDQLIDEFLNRSLINKNASVIDLINDMRDLKKNGILISVKEIINFLKRPINSISKLEIENIEKLLNDKEILIETLLPSFSLNDNFRNGKRVMIDKFTSYYDTDKFDFGLDIRELNKEMDSEHYFNGITYALQRHKSHIPAKLTFKIEEWILDWRLRFAMKIDNNKSIKEVFEEWFLNKIEDNSSNSLRLNMDDSLPWESKMLQVYSNNENLENIIKFEPIMIELKRLKEKRESRDYYNLSGLPSEWNAKTLEMIKGLNDSSLINLASKLELTTLKKESIMIKNILLEIVIRLFGICNESKEKDIDDSKLIDKLERIEKLTGIIQKLEGKD